MSQTLEQGVPMYHPDSHEGKALLAKQKLTLRELEGAITKYQKTEGAHVGTPIGINDQIGFVFSENDDWNPDDPNAFKETFGFIPWVQIHELLGNVPDGSTEGFGNAQ